MIQDVSGKFSFVKCDQWKAKLFGKEVTFHRYQQAFGALECLGMPWNALECLGMPWNALECLGMPWLSLDHSADLLVGTTMHHNPDQDWEAHDIT